MSLEPHVHCGECLREIATTVAGVDGAVEEAEIATGTQATIVMGPDGPSVVQRRVPLCASCFARISAQPAPGKLIVPQLRPPVLSDVQPAARDLRIAVPGIDSAEDCQ